MRTCEERQRYVNHFKSEYEDAKREHERLSDLFKDVCWYNFDTWGKWWGKRKRFVFLHGHRYRQMRPRQTFTSHRGASWYSEMAEFPLYYEGPADEAPRLPPALVMKEGEMARKHMEECRDLMNGPLDWAPGGARYEALRKVTLVGR